MNKYNDEITNEQTNNLLDGASGNFISLENDIDLIKKIAADKNLPLDERIEAFEDIFESEVGDTSMVRARNLEREFGLRQIYLKFEGNNPSGTQKDRIAFAQVMDALRRGFDAITVATCGNYGVAVAFPSSLIGIKCIVFIPQNYHSKRLFEIEKYGAEIIRVDGDYEMTVEASQKYAQDHEIYDANPGGANTLLQLKSYGEISYEIYDELRDAPSIVACPVSNGTTVAGIYKGFVSLFRRGKTSKLPRIVVGSSYKKNPIIQAFLSNKEKCEDLIPVRIKSTQVNEALINWHSIDGDYALEAIRTSSGWAGNVSDKSLIKHSKLIRELEGLNVLPASCAGLVSLIESHNIKPLRNDRYVVVLTGRK
ncbi:MAG: pyridoxal-phosphate dependent enzyme [Pseudomonadota bacterium]